MENDAFEYHQNLDYYTPTPLHNLKCLAKKTGVQNLYIKDESMRMGLNAFKALGASYAIHNVLKCKPDIETFCTASDGNHGKAVAWSAKQKKKKAIIYVPYDTSKNRIEAIKTVGGTVIQMDKNYDDTCKFAAQISKVSKWELLQDTAWQGYEEIPAMIMAGYLTSLKELENELHTLPKPKIDIVFIQAGVGSWAASAIWYYMNRYGRNKPQIIIVEPNESDGIFNSFYKNRRSNSSGNGRTIMAGLNCGIPSLSAWEIIKHGVNAVIKIPDDYAENAMRKLYYSEGDDPKIIAGESGVAAFAGFMALIQDIKYKGLRDYFGINEETNILCFNTEGATDIDEFNKIIGINAN
ncbi:diaminopropionate ammonia-lyase (plasmid) [Chondrinema litorale]|nr:diaminopropionate ammonia-lyase [Chondrinema litorale]UZR96597.1 diaminopropionate ammonia-lyase [Chondrinema litorale]